MNKKEMLTERQQMMKQISSLKSQNQYSSEEVERTKLIIGKLMVCFEEKQQNSYPLEEIKIEDHD